MHRTAVSLLLVSALAASGCGQPPSPLVIASGPRFRVSREKAEPASGVWHETKLLRVCADPDNLPFSNLAEEGVENRIAEILAADLDARLEYTWWPMRRGVARHPLKSRKCDVLLSLPASPERIEPTSPYYRSTYVFVTRRDRGLTLSSLDDPALQGARIGLQLKGNRPDPVIADALVRHGLGGNLESYRLTDDSTGEQALWQALRRGEADVAIVWGPLAGYFVKRAGADFVLRPVLNLAYGVSAGVRPGDTATRRSLEQALSRHGGEIHRLLLEYGFPLLAGQ